jgi:hypothetical protein
MKLQAMSADLTYFRGGFRAGTYPQGLVARILGFLICRNSHSLLDIRDAL